MTARRLLALAATLALSGCYTVACVEPDPVLVGVVCRERLESLFVDPSSSSSLVCHGQEAIGSCAGQGFTVPCDSCWLQPGSACP